MRDFFERKLALANKISDELMAIYLRGKRNWPPCAPEGCPIHNGRVERLLERYYKVCQMMPPRLP